MGGYVAAKFSPPAFCFTQQHTLGDYDDDMVESAYNIHSMYSGFYFGGKLVIRRLRVNDWAKTAVAESRVVL